MTGRSLFVMPGFDTASSIALLAVSAIARKGSDGNPIPSSYIVILPVTLFSLSNFYLPTYLPFSPSSSSIILALVHGWHDTDRFCRLNHHALFLLWLP